MDFNWEVRHKFVRFDAFTNDGTFANYCMHPSSSIDREYLVRARGDFTKEKKEKMLSGIKIDNDIYRFTDIVEGEKQSSNQWFSVCLMSGKNREVRKIFNAVGLEISRLKEQDLDLFFCLLH